MYCMSPAPIVYPRANHLLHGADRSIEANHLSQPRHRGRIDRRLPLCGFLWRKRLEKLWKNQRKMVIEWDCLGWLVFTIGKWWFNGDCSWDLPWDFTLWFHQRWLAGKCTSKFFLGNWSETTRRGIVSALPFGAIWYDCWTRNEGYLERSCLSMILGLFETRTQFILLIEIWFASTMNK